MIRAKFIKAEPTANGITYTLKGESDKVALHSAVDMQGEECIIGMAEGKAQETPKYDDFMEFIREQFAKIERLGYEKGQLDATQGNLLTEEKWGD